MRAYSIAIALVVSSAAACRTTGSNVAVPEDPLEQIQGWEDQRSLADGRLQRAVTAGAEEKVRVRALLALARIQAAETADTVAAVLADVSPAIRDAAAFAAGQLGLAWEPLPETHRELLTMRLLEVETAETDPNVRLTQLEALGKLATPRAQARLIERLTLVPGAGAGGDERVASRAALALVMSPRRGGTFPDAAFVPLRARAEELFAQQAAGDAPTDVRDDPRYTFAYALAVAKRPEALPVLRACVGAGRAEVRAICAKGLIDVAQTEDAALLGGLLADPDQRVVVEAVRALVKLAGSCGEGECPADTALAPLAARVDALIAGRRAEGGQPLLAFAQAWTHPRATPLITTLREKLRRSLHVGSAHAWDLARLDCRLAAAEVRSSGTLETLEQCGDASVPEWWRLAIALPQLAESPNADPVKRIEVLTSLLEDPRPTVRSAALGALGSLQTDPAAADQRIAERVRPLILDPDPYVATNAAIAAAKFGDAEALPQIHALALRVPEMPDLAGPLAEAVVTLKDPNARPLLQRWLKAEHAHVRHSAAKWLTELDGKPVHSEQVVRSDEPSRPSLSGERFLTIRLRGGEIRIRLALEDAPLTAGNLFALAKRGYFKGLTFHRIVPDFVVQGGDPHGDGEGGPGHTIRCEINRRVYQRGSVGMALSGKDTGGSQFFIATSPQPHLDGRYTIFGEVVSGLELADGLLEGEPILDIVAE